MADGITPLEVMLTAMRSAWGNADHQTAVSYAEKAAPYIHPKLSSIEHKGDAENPIETISHVQLTGPDGDSTHTSPAEAYPYLHKAS